MTDIDSFLRLPLKLVHWKRLNLLIIYVVALLFLVRFYLLFRLIKAIMKHLALGLMVDFAILLINIPFIHFFCLFLITLILLSIIFNLLRTTRHQLLANDIKTFYKNVFMFKMYLSINSLSHSICLPPKIINTNTFLHFHLFYIIYSCYKWNALFILLLID